MVTYEITNDFPQKLIIHEPGYPDEIFELWDRAPLGYVIWNIGPHMPEGYLPFGRPCARQPFDGGRNIEPDTLKAVPCEGAQVILAAVSACGAHNLRQMEAFANKYRNAKPGNRYFGSVLKAMAALPYMRTISWN